MYRILNNYNRLLIFLLADTAAILLSIVGSILLRFDFAFPYIGLASEFLSWLPVILLAKLGSFLFFNLYKGMYRFTSLWDIGNVIKANFIASISIVLIIGLFRGFQGFPRSLLIIDLILTTLFISANRILVRLYYSHFSPTARKIQASLVGRTKKRLLLIGAGFTGEKIAREIIGSPESPYQIIGFLDDNKRKHGTTMHGKKVFGNVANLESYHLDFDELLITAPSATGTQMRALVELCKLTGKPYKTVPNLSEIIDRDVSVNMIREVSYADLLNRAEVSLDTGGITKFLKGKRVLITGAGGSIGSELVRQCCHFDPATLILFDISEYNLFSVQQELSQQNHKGKATFVLGSVRDKNTLHKLMLDHRPQVILHAAAYKHVPLQETHPWEAVNTNVLGTMNLINSAVEHEVDHFVLVSTDKAVNPVNIMGATKRIAEIMIQAANTLNKTSFMAVRFGNVLGSSGSVIPIFEKQIKAGGPVTITHPDMTRYFMSIPEAAQLILQASALPKGRGRIYVLEMGDPVSIKDMAYDLISLSGYEPEVDIQIKYTGIRPGEKLYEELAFAKEKLSKTNHGKIMTLDHDECRYANWHDLEADILKLGDICYGFDQEQMKIMLMTIVPDYHPPESN
ncbi:MAG: polysaccharide biosynthesis protein [Candidatus Marinimicrobia bacterium]|nr:polysaccharide biosynthesis protein [Candidatus Neomarinimicrobiota bacterium]